MVLKDRVAIVTGGSRGIGQGIVSAFAAEGAKVVLVYRGRADAAEAIAAEAAAKGGVVKPVQGDVADPTTAPRVFDLAKAEFGKVDILVNNAGIIRDTLFPRMEAVDWDAVIATNLGGTFHFCKAAAFPMMQQRWGRIINITSVAAETVNKGQCNYAASKGAINSFTRTLALELAGRGVTVNAIAPGFIETDMSEAVRNKAGDDLIKKKIPAKRLGQPSDIAAAAVFLASDAAAYITGQVLTVDGGLTLGLGEG